MRHKQRGDIGIRETGRRDTLEEGETDAGMADREVKEKGTLVMLGGKIRMIERS